MNDDEDDGWPDEDDAEDDSDAETVPCPNCGAEVYEDADRCPACGEWVTHSTHPLSGRPWWFVALGLIGLLATAAALAFAF